MRDRDADKRILDWVIDCPSIPDDAKFALAQVHYLRNQYHDAAGEVLDRTIYLMGVTVPPRHPWALTFARLWTGPAVIYGGDLLALLVATLRDLRAQDDESGWAPSTIQRPATGAEGAYRAAMPKPEKSADDLSLWAGVMLTEAQDLYRIPAAPDEATRTADKAWKDWVDEHIKNLVTDFASSGILTDEAALAGLARALDETIGAHNLAGLRRISRQAPDLASYMTLCAAWGLRKHAIAKGETE